MHFDNMPSLRPSGSSCCTRLVPTATVVALLVNPTSPDIAETTAKDLQAAARTLGLQIHVLHASTERDFDTVFAALVQLRAGALVIGSRCILHSRSEASRDWRSVTRCPRSTSFASSPRPGA